MEDIRDHLGNEQADFVFTARRAAPLRIVGIFLAFGAVFLAAAAGILIFFSRLGILDVSPILFLPSGILLLLAAVFVLSGLWYVWAPGPTFAGTATRLAIQKGKVFRSVDWNQFAGNSSVWVKEGEGTISLHLKGWTFIHTRRGGGRFIPRVVWMVGVPDVEKISEKIRARIRQNAASGTRG